MLLVVTGVGFLIHIYSDRLHVGGRRLLPVLSYLNLFMFFMLTLVLAKNYLLMFIGWEGVGLASYLLIGFWFTKDSAASAGKKAFIMNRIGDFGFLIGLFLMIQHFGSLDYTQVFDSVSKLPWKDRHRPAYRHRAAVNGWRGRQVCADSAICLASGRDGRSNTGLRINSRRDHGDSWRLHGGSVACGVRSRTDRAHSRGDHRDC